MDMRKDWIRTDEEREQRRMKLLAKEAAKSNQSTEQLQYPMNFSIVVRRKQRLATATKKVPAQTVNVTRCFSSTQ